MTYVGDHNLTVYLRDGVWTGTLDCPAPGCSGRATLSSSEKTGPYTGSCTKGHYMEMPIAKRGPKP